MKTLFVVNEPRNWPLALPDVEVVAARAYLTRPEYSRLRRTRIYNLCRSYRYQSLGYYVSLLAEARGHRPMPRAGTIRDLSSSTLTRLVSGELEEDIQRSLSPIVSETFVLSVYFGRNLARRHQRVATRLFELFPAPLLRVRFERQGGRWGLHHAEAIPASQIPEGHRAFVMEAARHHFERPYSRRRRGGTRFDLAILRQSGEGYDAPSNESAIRRFLRAARRLGFAAEVIGREDYTHLLEYDALFIRAITAVHNATFRFARRAAAEGLAVIDDPESIIKCGNKVYLAELLEHHRVPAPRTLVVHRDNVAEIAPCLGLPCVLKVPDSFYSRGVVKVDEPEALDLAVRHFLERSDLIIAQEFLQTDFDWRIGVLDRRPLWACRYYMAHRHWQIIKRSGVEESRYGRVEAVPVESVPPRVVRTALRAANLIGDGLYGVDLKQRGGRVFVIEVNENPSIDGGFEDAVLGDELYLAILRSMLARVERLRGGGNGRP